MRIDINVRLVRRYAGLFLSIALLLLFAACSYITDFVVVNISNQPIEVLLTIKKDPSRPFGPRIKPARMPNSQLRSEGQWQELEPGQYALDSENRTILVRVGAGEALRIERLQRGGMVVDEADESRFSIEGITITGASGTMTFQGSNVRNQFVVESKKLYTLTYK